MSTTSIASKIDETQFNPEVQSRKIFVGGLSPDTTSDELINYFSKFGEVEDVNLIGELKNKPRGYGFVSFKKEDAVKAILASKSHEINGRLADCGIALLPGTTDTGASSKKQSFKLYVAKIPRGAKKDEITKLFGLFGKVQQVLLVLRSNRDDAFAFIDFASKEALERALSKGTIEYKGKVLTVEKAIPKKAKPGSPTEVASEVRSNHKINQSKREKQKETEGVSLDAVIPLIKSQAVVRSAIVFEVSVSDSLCLTKKITKASIKLEACNNHRPADLVLNLPRTGSWHNSNRIARRSFMSRVPYNPVYYFNGWPIFAVAMNC